MIEEIRTFRGKDRGSGRVIVVQQNMYRCTLCGLIKPTKIEFEKHDCVDKNVRDKNENSSM